MKLRILLLLASVAFGCAAQDAGCHAVEGDRILARDLAEVLPQFAPVAPETLLGQAPLPGAQRNFHPTEIQALARRFSIEVPPDASACFAWTMHPLDRQQVIEAMQQSLGIADAHIEIADLMTAPVPPGRIDFPANRLGTPASPQQQAPVLWRGDIVYGDQHRFAIWARVEISAPCNRLVAAENLKSGDPISEHQVRTVEATCFPAAGKSTPSLDEVVGMVPTRAVTAGGEVRPEYLVAPYDVDRGDEVQVEVRSGAARLALTAKALSAGRHGDTISLRNPDSNRTFQARITGKGTAVVNAGTKGS